MFPSFELYPYEIIFPSIKKLPNLLPQYPNTIFPVSKVINLPELESSADTTKNKVNLVVKVDEVTILFFST